jgi:hypothetical protein
MNESEGEREREEESDLSCKLFACRLNSSSKKNEELNIQHHIIFQIIKYAHFESKYEYVIWIFLVTEKERKAREGVD